MQPTRHHATTAEFRTSDVGLVAYLIHQGYELLEYVMRHVDGGKKKTIYTLDNSPALKASVEDYYQDRASMGPFQHSQKVRELIRGSKELE